MLFYSCALLSAVVRDTKVQIAIHHKIKESKKLTEPISEMSFEVECWMERVGGIGSLKRRVQFARVFNPFNTKVSPTIISIFLAIDFSGSKGSIVDSPPCEDVQRRQNTAVGQIFELQVSSALNARV